MTSAAATNSSLKPQRQMSPGGITTLKHMESKNGIPDLVAYKDQGGVWTWGFGHTGKEVVEGYTGTAEQANIVLDNDLDKVEFALCKYTDYKQFNDNQFDALALLLYNAGVGVLQQPQFSKAIKPDPKTGKIDMQAVGAQFPKWVWVTDEKTGKKFIDHGLVNRRAAELTLFNTPVAAAAEEPKSADAPIQPVLPAIAVAPLAVRVEAPDPQVNIPTTVSSATPIAPPANVAQSSGGKSLIATVGATVSGAITLGYNQIVDIASQVNNVRNGMSGFGKAGNVAGLVVCAGIVTIALFTVWQRHKDVKTGKQ